MRKLFQIQCPALLYFILVYISTLYCSCTNTSAGFPKGYSMHNPLKKELGKVLNEISGLTYNSDSQTLLAISDSKQNIYEINVKTQKLSDYANKFYDKADFEDLVKLGKTIYVLISDGTIVAVPAQAKSNSQHQVYKLGLQGTNDFETLYYDSSVNGLILLCKSCEGEKGERTAYRFDLKTHTFDSTAFYTLNSDSVKSKVKDMDAKIRPSAAAIHPIDKRLYILSSAGQLLIITNNRGQVLDAFKLNPDHHPQAEGIAFDANGNMYISNEGKFGKATLQIFPYKRRKW